METSPSSSSAPPPGGKPYREVTIAALVFAVIVGVVMNASITYAGLKIGFTIGGSAIAAVLGFGILRGIMRKGTILETNIAQTVASAVNTSNSGIIFTVPVLLLIGYKLTPTGSDFWLITLAAMAGAVLGAAFIIPLRKQMIDIDRLRFPTGTGVAVILKSPGAGAKKAIVLGVGIAIGALVNLPAVLPEIKLNASVEQLDTLFEDEKISYADVERTRDIAGWINAEAAPANVVERGRIVAELKEAKAELRDAKRAGEDATGATARVNALEAALGEVEPTPLFSDELALAAYRASTGEKRWSSLRSQSLGWAGSPLPGYSNLNFRLKREVDADQAPRDLDGDGTPDEVLTRRVDRDENGKADLLVDNHTIDVGRWLGLPAYFQLVFAIAPFALGAGYITGRPGLLVLAGGILAYFVLTPVAFKSGWMPASIYPDQAPGTGFQFFNRPLGIGLLLGGAIMGVLASIPAIREALKSVAAAGKLAGGRGGDELGLKPLIVAVIGAVALLFVSDLVMGNKPVNTHDPITQAEIDVAAAHDKLDGYRIAFDTTESYAAWQEMPEEEQRTYLKDNRKARPGLLSGLPSILKAAIIALVGAAWIWLAGIIIAQCTGMTDWSPISGMALLTVVFILMLAGSGAVVGAVLVGAALCVAITLAADMMQDLKTGQLLGAQPRRQQLCELVFVAVGPLIAMLTVLVIAQVNMKSYGVPMGGPTPTPAPQAQALQAVIQGVQGNEMPYALYGFGALLGALLGLGAFSGLGVLVGLSMYLPFMYIATYGVGCVINMIVGKVKGRRWAEDWGVPLAAGLIVGDSLLGLFVNLIVLGMG